MKLRYVFLCMLVLVSAGSWADEHSWKSELGLGLVITSGNTEEENFNSKGEFTRDAEQWRHKFLFDTLRSSKEGELAAQKFYGSYQMDYKFSDDRFFFSRVSYENDRFSGYDYQADLTFGYGQSLIKRDNMKLTADIGPGVRWSKLDSGETKSEMILRAAGAYEWAFSEHATFSQTLSSEFSKDKTVSRSVTALKSNVSDRLAMKLAYSVKHSSEVPVGASKTDTETSVNLVYSF